MKTFFYYFLWSQSVFATIGYFLLSGVWCAAGTLLGIWILATVYYQVEDILNLS